jgi:hypothetical protein
MSSTAVQEGASIEEGGKGAIFDNFELLHISKTDSSSFSLSYDFGHLVCVAFEVDCRLAVRAVKRQQQSHYGKKEHPI